MSMPTTSNELYQQLHIERGLLLNGPKGINPFADTLKSNIVDETIMPWYKVTKQPQVGETEMTLEEMDAILQAQQTAIDRASYDAVVARLPTSYNLMNIEQTNQMKTAYETYFLNDEKTKNLTIALLIGGLLTTGVILLVRK